MLRPALLTKELMLHKNSEHRTVNYSTLEGEERAHSVVNILYCW